MSKTTEHIIDAVTTRDAGNLLAHLTKPTRAYQFRAQLALFGLLAFIVLYLGLAGWFLYAAWRLFASGSSGLFQYIGATCSAFLGVFMFKAVFSVRNARPDNLHEITPEQQPRLFAFLNALADAAGAPRPHKVYLSNEVNAAVFYDLSLFNLIFPSRKNLLIGLPLVNALNMGELRAVLAHEFGHFAQRSMAVGRWVYVAQQIAAHLVARRDSLEDMLDGLGRVDLRIRVVVMVVQLVIWAIRSVIDSAFRVVVMMQRALSREMEMQADLVAVSLTGSDALVHALHRLQVADDAWNRAQQFIFGERHEKRRIPDAYAIQQHVTERMGRILADQYAPVPPVPAEAPDAHRLFKPEMAQPPRMWLTHPLNHEREANAKRHYVTAPIDAAPAWNLFDNVPQLRSDMTAELLGPADGEVTTVDLESSLKALGQVYRREQFSPRYQGVYFGRSLTRHVDKPAQLRTEQPVFDLAAGARLYPVSLQQDVSQLRTLETQADQLKAIIAGAMKVEGGTVHLNGESLRKTQLPEALSRIEADMAQVVERLHQHDAACRSWHRAVALKLGKGWPEYLDGALAILHFAEHVEAELRDLQGMLHNTVAVATAAGRVNERRADTIVSAASQLHQLLEHVYITAPKVQLDERLLAKPDLAAGWAATLGEFTLGYPERDNLGDWLNASDSWANHTGACLSILRSAALEQLLLAEAQVTMAMRPGAEAADAPAPAAVDGFYPCLLKGAERERVMSIGWWARFLRADGMLAEAARLSVAAIIVALVIGAGTTSYMASGASIAAGGEAVDNLGRSGGGVTAFNGLATSVVVSIDGEEKSIAPHGSVWFDVGAGTHRVATRAADGRQIEAFEDKTADNSAHVYNVAAAAPLVIWTASYGQDAKVPPHVMGAQRWAAASVDHAFSPPPTQIKGVGTRRVLDTGDGYSISHFLEHAGSDAQRKQMVIQHARFDDPNSADIDLWLRFANEQGVDVLPERLAAQPKEVQWLRAEQDRAEGTPAFAAVCARHKKHAAAAPDNPDLIYLGLRCGNTPADNAAMVEAAKRWPDHVWLANAASYELVTNGKWKEAVPTLEKLLNAPPVLASAAAPRLARIKRVLGQPYDRAAMEKIAPELVQLHALDAGYGDQNEPGRAYVALSNGQLALALNLSAEKEHLGPHVLRFAAASDGAGRETVQRALALPPATSLNTSAAFAMWGLALREQRDPAPYRNALEKQMDAKSWSRIHAFLTAVDARPSDTGNVRKLDGLVPELRAMAMTAALVQHGQKVPAGWRREVRGLLFANERPYFVNL